MKQDELRRALGRIQPSDALVSDTLEKMRLYKVGEENRSGSSSRRSFAMRLAPSLAALALLIGVGFTIDKSPLFPTADTGVVEAQVEKDARVLETPIGTDIEAYGVATVGDGILSEASAEAKIDSCYFLEVTEEERQAGVAFNCAIRLTPLTVISGDISADAPIEAYMSFGDEQSLNDFVNIIGGVAKVELFSVNENDRPVWHIASCMTK